MFSQCTQYVATLVKDTYQCKILLVWMMAWRLINIKPALSAAVGYIHFSGYKYTLCPSGPNCLDYYKFLIIQFLVQCDIFV